MRNYPHTPTDYRHTDKHLRLVMVLIALYCTRQSRTSLRAGKLTLTLSPTFDLDPDL